MPQYKFYRYKTDSVYLVTRRQAYILETSLIYIVWKDFASHFHRIPSFCSKQKVIAAKRLRLG